MQSASQYGYRRDSRIRHNSGRHIRRLRAVPSPLASQSVFRSHPTIDAPIPALSVPGSTPSLLWSVEPGSCFVAGMLRDGKCLLHWFQNLVNPRRQSTGCSSCVTESSPSIRQRSPQFPRRHLRCLFAHNSNCPSFNGDDGLAASCFPRCSYTCHADFFLAACGGKHVGNNRKLLASRFCSSCSTSNASNSV